MDEARVARLHGEANARRWDLPPAVFAEALARSVAKAAVLKYRVRVTD